MSQENIDTLPYYSRQFQAFTRYADYNLLVFVVYLVSKINKDGAWSPLHLDVFSLVEESVVIRSSMGDKSIYSRVQ